MDKKLSKSKSRKIEEKQKNDMLEANIHKEDSNNFNAINVDSENKIKKKNKKLESSLKKAEDKSKMRSDKENENLKTNNKISGKKLDKKHVTNKVNSSISDDRNYKRSSSSSINKDFEIKDDDEIRKYQKTNYKNELKENKKHKKEENKNQKSKTEEIKKEEIKKLENRKSKTERNKEEEIENKKENKKEKTEEIKKEEIKKLENRKSKTEGNKEEEISKQKLEKIKKINKLIKDVNENEVYYGISTKRLAVLNLDWDFIKPEDIFFQFKSFLNSEDELISVNFCKTSNEKDNLPEIGSIDVDGKKEKDKDQMQLRKYLLEKRKCFMVVAEFRDVIAAERIYEMCDGLELEESMNYYDLRFLPDNFKLENIIQTVTNTSNYEYCKIPRSLVFQNKIKYEWDVDIKRENFFKKLFEQEIMDEKLANKLIDISDEDSNKISFENQIKKSHKNISETKNNILVKKIKQKEKKSVENKKSKKSEFIFNPNDERFANIYDSRDYAIDVTHPNFRKSERGLKEILKEKRKYNEPN